MGKFPTLDGFAMTGPTSKALAVKEVVWGGGLLGLWAIAEPLGIVLGLITAVLVCGASFYRFKIARMDYKDRKEEK